MAQPGELVLVLDGNSTRRTQLAQALARGGYQALEAATLSQARAIARAPIIAVISGEPIADGVFSVPVLLVREAPAAVAAVRKATASPATPFLPRMPEVAEPAEFSEAATRLAPAASPEELELIAALKDELAFLRNTTFFRVLELEPDASAAKIAVAFDRFSARWHPDRLSATASQDMRAIAAEIYLCGKAAYDVLSDERKRRIYQPATPEPFAEQRASTRRSVLRRILGKDK